MSLQWNGISSSGQSENWMQLVVRVLGVQIHVLVCSLSSHKEEGLVLFEHCLGISGQPIWSNNEH